MSRIEIQDEVVYYDTDCGGVVSNIAYLRFVEKARCALFADLGMPLKKTVEDQLFPTVVRTEIDYRRPAKLGDVITVTAGVAEVEKVRMNVSFSLTGKSGEGETVLFAEAKQTIALISFPKGRPARIPPEWLDTR